MLPFTPEQFLGVFVNYNKLGRSRSQRMCSALSRLHHFFGEHELLTVGVPAGPIINGVLSSLQKLAASTATNCGCRFPAGVLI